MTSGDWGMTKQDSGRKSGLEDDPVEDRHDPNTDLHTNTANVSNPDGKKTIREALEAPWPEHLLNRNATAPDSQKKCLCSFAHPGELKEIELWFPETAEHIRRIERKVREAGFPWGWEEQPPPLVVG